MPDYSFIANPQTSNGLQSLSSIMNTANAAQNLKMNALNIQQKQETLPADIARAQAESSQAQTQATGAQWKLDSEQAAAARQIAGGLLSDSAIQKGESEGSVFSLMRAEDQMRAASIPEEKIRAQMAPFYTMAAHAPENLMPMLKQVAGASIAPSSQISNVFPNTTMTNQGQFIVPQATGNAALTGVQPGTVAGTSLKTQITPAEQQTVGMNAQGQPYVINKNTENAQVTGISGIPLTNAPGATQPFVMPTSENADTLKVAQGIRQEANQAASGLSTTQAFANNAIQYANGAVTGTGAQFINDLKGQYAGTPWTAPGVTDSNLMGHALSQLTGSLIKATGLSTNQGQSLIANQVADGAWTKPAIQTASREVRALSTGASLYSQGIENRIAQVAQTDPSASQFAARTFQNDWAKVADVNAFKLYDSLKNRAVDPGALTNPDKTGILDKLGGPTAKNPKGSILYQQTLQHIDAMKQLLSGR